MGMCFKVIIGPEAAATHKKYQGSSEPKFHFDCGLLSIASGPFKHIIY